MLRTGKGFLIFCLLMSLSAAPSLAGAVTTSYGDIAVEWDCGFADLQQVSEAGQYPYDLYYESAQFSPSGDILTIRITLPAQYAQNVFSNITLWSKMGGTCPYGIVKQVDQTQNSDFSFSDLVLEAKTYVSVANPTYNAFIFYVQGYTSQSVDSEADFFVIVDLAKSARKAIPFRAASEGGCADNPFTGCEHT